MIEEARRFFGFEAPDRAEPARVIAAPSAQKWDFLRNVIVLGGGSAVAQALALALSPVITRLYAPAELGALGVFTTFLNVAAVGVALRYEFAIVSAVTEHDAALLTLLSMLIAAPVSVLGGLVFAFMIQQALFGFGTLPMYSTVLTIPALFLAACFAALRYWFVRQQGFGVVSRGFVAQSCARSISQLLFGAVGFGAPGLMLGEMLGRCAGVGRMLRGAWPNLKRHAISAGRDDCIELMKRNRKFPILSLPSSFIDTLASNIALPLLVALYGVAAGGHFALVQKSIGLPLFLVSASVADAFHSRLAEHARTKPDQVLPLFRRMTLGLAAVGFVPMLLLILFGRPAFAFLFGQRWELAGTMGSIIAPWYLAQFIVSPLTRLVLVFQGQEFKLAYDVAALLSILAIFSVAKHAGMSLVHTIAAFSAANVLSYALYYLVLLRIISRAAQKRPAHDIQ